MGTPSRYYSTKAIELRLYAVDSSTTGNLPSSDSVGTTHQIELRDKNNNTTNFNLPTNFPYTLILDPDLDTEEVVTVTSAVGNIYTITRGSDGSNINLHNAGSCVVKHGVSARDYSDSRQHEADTSGVHGLTGTVVGTTDTQTLTNKSLTSPTLTGTATAATLNVTTALQINGTAFSGAWTTFTPTLNNWTVGNGTWDSAYVQIGKTVIWRCFFTAGSTTSFGTGPTLSLPTTAKTSGTPNMPTTVVMRVGSPVVTYIGSGWVSGTNTFSLIAHDDYAKNYVSGATITTAIPGTWASGNTFGFTLMYEAA